MPAYAHRGHVALKDALLKQASRLAATLREPADQPVPNPWGPSIRLEQRMPEPLTNADPIYGHPWAQKARQMLGFDRPIPQARK